MMKKSRHIQLLPKNGTYDTLESPVGTLTIITSPEGLHAILWDNDQDLLTHFAKDSNEKNIIKTKKQLQEYFNGNRTQFNLPIVLRGTDFQKQACQQLLNIPYGHTISYSEQANNLGDKNKARAVGMANSVNPISIVVPCHRVIGSNNKLVGFAGGLDKKAYLLELEKSAGV